MLVSVQPSQHRESWAGRSTQSGRAARSAPQPTRLRGHHKARKREHGEAAVLDLLDLQLLHVALHGGNERSTTWR